MLQNGKNITRLVVQRRNEENGILYELELITNKGEQNEDLKTFDNIIRTFKTHVLPK